MTSAAPTIFALETDSAWVVILAVSVVTLVATILLRRLIARPGGVASGVLLSLPLLLPLIGAILYEHAVLPEIGVLRPAGPALLERSGELLHLLLLSDSRERLLTPYALTGSAGPWLLLIGVGVSGFMLVRRGVGQFLIAKLISRCEPAPSGERDVTEVVARLTRSSALKKAPDVLLLPEGVAGAFAVGGRRKRILISRDLLQNLTPEELEGILAHELAHIESHDLALVFTAGVLRDMTAWNPLAHLAYRRLSLDRELEADRRAAALTGKPLQLASGLLKVCEGMRTARRGTRHHAALALIRPGGRLSRRVGGLLAMADGRTSAASVGPVPYVAAAALVALLGLQVAATVASPDTRALAIVWGAPASGAAEILRPADLRALDKAARARGAAKPVVRHKAKAGHKGVLFRYPDLAGAVSVRAEDYDHWLKAMDAWARGVRPVKVRWKARRDWQAVPLYSNPTLGIYRIDAQ